MIPRDEKPTEETAPTSEGGWSPITLQELHDLIRQSEALMSPAERRLWDCIRIQPAKWQETTYGDEGGGFWAVGILGGSVFWYNDIEDGFNVSRYSTYGELSQYWCNQDDLHHRISSLCQYLHPDVSSEIGPGGSPPESPG
jgi:hypothetical protein